MPIKRTITATIVLIIGLAIAIPMTGTHAEPVAPVAPAPNLLAGGTCEEILTRAMQSLQSTCSDVTRNNACYGNNQVKAEPNAGAALKFDVVGDRASIRNIRSLVTSPLNVDTGTWGLSLLKLQANLPDTLPGQNVTFLVFGNTSVENTSGDMQSFYFTTGLGNLNCKAAPKDAIVVRSPQNTEVTFTANGVRITIASTVVLRAERNKSMSIELVEGNARLSTAAGSQTLKPGQVSTVTLGGANGLTATDAPSVPVPAASDAALGPVFVTAGKVVDPDAPVKITIQGCVSRAEGDTVTVNDYPINVGDSGLKNAKVGDCVEVDGTLSMGDDNKVKMDVVRAQPAASGNANAGGGGTPVGGGKPTGTGRDGAATRTAGTAVPGGGGQGGGGQGGGGQGGGGQGGGGQGGGQGGGGQGGGQGGGGGGN